MNTVSFVMGAEWAAPSGSAPREGTMNGVPLRCASASCCCSQELLRRHMADWAPPEAQNRESSSNSLKISARCCWVVSCLVNVVMSNPVAAHHALNLLEVDTAVNDTRLSEPWFAKTLLQHVLHNLAAELVVCEL